MSDDISVLGIAVEQRGVKEGAAALDKLAESGKRAEKSTDGLTGASKKATFEISALAKSAASAAVAYGAWASIKGIAASMIEAQQSAQKLRNSLEYSAGSSAGASKELSYLREVTHKLGLDFTSASSAYAKFAAATKDTGVSAAQTKTVFEGIAAASAKLGLSSDETNGALLALSQMASKGTVSAEELRGQLGERLPGAFKISAEAMGVTTKELEKMLETGQIMSADFLPRFGEALKQHFEAPLGSITQEINRLNSAWDLWKQEISEGTNGDGFKWLTQGINESAAAMKALGDEAGIVHKLLVAIGGFEFGAMGGARYNTAEAQNQSMQELSAIKARVAALREEKETARTAPSGTRNRIDYQLNTALKEEVAIREKLMKLAVQRGKETGINLPDLKGEYEAQQKKKNDALNDYLGDTSNASKQTRIAAAVEKENKAFKTAVAEFSETDKEYQSALKAHNERIAEITKEPKGTGGGSDGIANATLSFDLARIKRESDQLAAIYAGSERIIEANHAAGLMSDKEYYESKAAFIRLNAEAQESALQQEIDRLSREKVSGKERIDNLQKIADAQAQIDKIRLEAGFATAVNGTQEEAAIRKVAQAYESARASAQSYIDTIKLQSAREIAGYGMGAEYRKEQGDQNKIEDKFLSRRSSLDEQKRAGQITQEAYDEYLSIARKTYEEEVSIHATTREAIIGKQADWSVGASEALANYAEESRNVAKQTEDLFTNAFKAAEDAFVEFAKTGKLSFSDLADSIIEEMARIAFKQASAPILSGISEFIAKSFSGFNSGGIDYSMLGTGYVSGARASGGPVSSGETYLVGERGPELLTMGGNGYITPNNALGGGMNVTINNSVADQAEVSVQPKMNNGQMELEVIVQRVLAKDMNRNGPITQGLAGTFGLARAI